jgi:Cu/Ag efflux pump CusA
VQGPELGEIQRIGAEIEKLLTGVRGTRGVFAERVIRVFT